MEQNTASLYDDDLTVGMEETEDFLDTGFVDLFEHSNNNGSPISRLKTIVLSIDWEINNEILTQFNDELLALKDVWAGDQIKLVYVQALQKISKYIYQLKADAHPNAIKLLLTFYYNLEKIVLGTELTEVETKEILREDIKKFEKLKHQIGVVSETSKPESGPETGTTPPATVQSEPHPILFNLKACILGMDWEITERELTDLGQEVGRLEQEFAGRKPQMIFLQGIGALGGYIKLKKSDAHADAFKLLYSFYEGLEKIVVNPDLSKEEIKEILLPEVEKFEDFKTIVASTITPEAIAEKIVDEQPAAYGEDKPDTVSPAFSDVPDEVHGFQAEEEAATLGSAPDDVDNRLDTFFSGDEKSKKPSDTAGILPPEAIEKIDSFFGDDIVDDALSVSSISAEDALKGVDVETEADDDSDEEALPTEGDGMLAPALADSAENEQHGFNPDISAEESLYAATDVDASINDIFAEGVADDVVSKAAALQGVDVESEADDDSDEQPLPKENEDIAPALAMEDFDSESAEEFQVESEGSEIDAQIKGFFGDDSEEDEPTSIEPDVFAEEGAVSALSEVSEDEVVDIPESEELPEGIEDRLDSFFAEPDEDNGALSDDQFGAGVDEVVFKAIDDEDSAFLTEDIATGILEEELEEFEGFEEVEVDTAEDEADAEEELAAFDTEAAVEDEVDTTEEELAAFEAEAVVEDEVDTTEEELAAFEAEAAVEDEADTTEEELAAFEAEAVVEDEADTTEEELAAFEAEAAVEDEADAEEELAAFDAEAVVEDEAVTEEELAAFEAEAETEEELAAFEAEAVVEDEVDTTEEELAAFDAEAVVEDEADTEEELAAFEAEAAVEDEADAEEELAAFDAEAGVEDEADAEEELTAFDAEAAGEDETDAEEELAAFDAEAGVEDEADAEEELAAFDAEAAVEDEAVTEEELAAFDAEAAGQDEADLEEDEADMEEEGVAHLVSEFVAEDETVSSFGSDSEEEDFFAAIDDRVEEPGEIQIELLSETDKFESELVTDHDEIDGVEVIADQEGYTDADLTEVLSEQSDDEAQALSFAINDELSELRAGVASLGIEINDNIIEGLLTEINRLRHRMMTKPLEKTFLQLLSTIVQHIGQYKYESSSDAHTLVLSVFDKLELSQKSETAQEQSQEILLAETCKVLLWQQKMLDRQAGKKGDELTFPDPIRVVEPEPVEEGAERSTDAEYEALSGVDSGTHDLSKQDFTAVFEPVDDGEEFAAYEEIETTQEGLEHELGEAFIENESQPIHAEGDQSADSASSEDKIQLKSGSGPDNLPETLKENEKSEIKGLTTILTDLVKREMKALKDLLQTELKALKDKLRDKDKK